jgi:hypothetical protein
MLFCILIETILYGTCQVATEYVCFMKRFLRAIVSYRRILS